VTYADFNPFLTPHLVTHTMTSTKPYLMRAIFEWTEDNSFTAQVLVDAEADGVEVPKAHVVDGQIVLNISSSAVQLHIMDNECISFSARFSGVEQDIFLPIDSILAIFARENSQGIFFDDMDENGTDPEPTGPARVPSEPTELKTKTKPKRDTSHLKIIK
jgi:stringent starvation protein B